MDTGRKPFQGILNILRFNWPYYVWGLGAAIILTTLSVVLTPPAQTITLILGLSGILLLLSSAVVSTYVYDLSPLFKLEWLPDLSGKSVLVVNAGFDEISPILQTRHPGILLTSCDFYDPLNHTEPSIKRARAAYPPVPGTLTISTNKLPFESGSFDYCIAFLSVHEVRDLRERAIFLKEISRVLKPESKLYITEHLRDISNFLAYTIGFFHFHSKAVWIKTFKEAGVVCTNEIKITPFITTFIVSNYADPPQHHRLAVSRS